VRKRCATLEEEYNEFKSDIADEIAKKEEEQARYVESLNNASAEEKARITKEAKNLRLRKEADIARKETSLKNMWSNLEALSQRVTEAEESERIHRAAAARAEREAADKAAQIAGRNYDSPHYLHWLFGLDGGMQAHMDFGQFIHVCHQYMVYLRAVFGIECQVTALEFDQLDGDDANSDAEVEERFTNYNRHLFRVIATTPAMSLNGHVHFQDAGSALPQEADSMHYVACNSGQTVETNDKETKLMVVCAMLRNVEGEAKSRGPAWGTITWLIPDKETLGFDETARYRKANLTAHKPSFTEAMHTLEEFSGQVRRRTQHPPQHNGILIGT
jgi:hypothetical protein